MNSRSFDLLVRGIALVLLGAFLAADIQDLHRRELEMAAPRHVAAADYLPNPWGIREWCLVEGSLAVDAGIRSSRPLDDNGKSFELTYIFPFEGKPPKQQRIWAVLTVPPGKAKSHWYEWVPKGPATFAGLVGTYPDELKSALNSVGLSPETSAALLAVDQRAAQPLPGAVHCSLAIAASCILLILAPMIWGRMRSPTTIGTASAMEADAGPSAAVAQSSPSWLFLGLMLVGGILFLGIVADISILRSGISDEWNTEWLTGMFMGFGGGCLVFASFIASGSIAVRSDGIAIRSPWTGAQAFVPFPEVASFLCRRNDVKGIPVWVLQIGTRDGAKHSVWVLNASGATVSDALLAKIGPLLGPSLTRRWRDGDELSFDNVRMDRHSVRVKGITGWTLLPFDQLETATIEGPLIKLTTHGPGPKRASISYTTLTNGYLLPEVLGHAIQNTNPQCTISWAAPRA